MDLSERIQLLLDRKSMKQTELEKALGFGKGTISKWRGETSPSIDKLMKIADFFTVSLDYLANGENESSLTIDEELNVIDNIDEIMKRIKNNETVVLRFDGEDYSGNEDEDELLRESLLSLCRAAKLKKKRASLGE